MPPWGPIVPVASRSFQQADESAKIRNDDIGYVEIIIDKRSRGRDSKIAMVVDEVIVQRPAYSELPTWRKIIAVTEIGVETSGVGTLRVKKTCRDLDLARAVSGRRDYGSVT
jgi:hypothetical protein